MCTGCLVEPFVHLAIRSGGILHPPSEGSNFEQCIHVGFRVRLVGMGSAGPASLLEIDHLL